MNFLSFLSFFGTSIAFIWAFWALYVLTMGMYRAYLNKKLNGATYVLGFPFFVVAYLVDVISQYTIAVLVFMDLPDSWSEHMVTSRLQRYMKGPDGWRKTIAKYICDKLLDPFDPKGDHC